jgi:adenylylsulfate kinase
MKYSLFIGRWQPFHEGHQKLIQKVLDEGKNVCVAIRDTEISDENPFTAQEREQMILKAFPVVKVIVIPDIEEVVFGRKVGWGIREIKLDEATEKISATIIRKGMKRGKNLMNSLYL